MSELFKFGGEIAWKPSEDYLTSAHLTHFMRAYNLRSFDELYKRSTSDIAWFTDAILKYLNIHFDEPYQQVIDLARGNAWPIWCVGGRMNIYQSCLEKYIGTVVYSQPAVIWEREDGKSDTLTYGQLHDEAEKVASALKGLGIIPGDVVALYMPMVPEIAASLLGIAKIGAVSLPLFSGYGADAIQTRCNDAGAKVILTADGYLRRGKVIQMKLIADKAAEQIPSLKYMVMLDYAGVDVEMTPQRDYRWSDVIGDQTETVATVSTSAEDTLMVLYTSGTTGKPKGAVHTHCGFPIKAAQDMAFGTDVHPADVIYWMTDMGWMMGPWLVYGSLLLGATMVLYDGAPDYPDADRIWQLIDKHHVNILGISPTYIRAVMQHEGSAIQDYNLKSLHLIASTGEPWNPDPWWWLFDKVGKGKLPIINYSGGTEISGGILMGNPILPMKPCSFSAACPGMAVDIYDENGQPVIGQVGELVIKAPWIGMTRGFWNDPKRYEETYWADWPGIWKHGDFAVLDDDGMWYILGRSDDTLKIAGKRVGPAEIESIAVTHSDVIEAAAIGIPDEIKGNSLVLFCVLVENPSDRDAVCADLEKLIVSGLGKPLSPKEIQIVPDLPKTRNAKVMRRIIRAAYLGEDPGDISALVNPEAIAGIAQSR